MDRLEERTATKLGKLAWCLINQHHRSFLAAARNDRLLLGLSGSIDLVGIDDVGHSVEPHDFPGPWVRKRHGLVAQPPSLPPHSPMALRVSFRHPYRRHLKSIPDRR